MNDLRDRNDERRDRWRERWEQRMERRRDSKGHIWTGLFLLIIGGLALAKSLGVLFPDWLFTWQMLLVGIGILIGVKHGFRDGGWFVPIIIGGFFLLNERVFHRNIPIWPIILIVIGLFFVFRPRRRRWQDWQEKKSLDVTGEGITPQERPEQSKDDFIDSTNIFSGTKKVVLSKHFKGGDITNIFGGCELDMTQSDMQEPATLDVTAIFGGATLIVPANWAIKTDATTIFGGITDKRKFPATSEAASRTLILDGTIIFGGIEVRNY